MPVLNHPDQHCGSDHLSDTSNMPITSQPSSTILCVDLTDPHYATFCVHRANGTSAGRYRISRSILIERSGVFCSAFQDSHKSPNSSIIRLDDNPPRALHEMLQYLQDRDIDWNGWDGADEPQSSLEAANDVQSKAFQLLVLAERYQIPSLRNDMLAVLLTKLPMLCDIGDQKNEMSAALFLRHHMQPLETALGLEYMSEAMYSAPWQRLVVERWNDKRPLTDTSFMWRYLAIHEQLLERAQKLRDALRYEADTNGKLSVSQKPERVRAIRHLGHLLIACATSPQPYCPRFVERKDRTLDLLQDTLFMRAGGCVEREDRMLDVWEDTLSLRSGDLLPASVLSTFGKRIRYE